MDTESVTSFEEEGAPSMDSRMDQRGFWLPVMNPDVFEHRPCPAFMREFTHPVGPVEPPGLDDDGNAPPPIAYFDRQLEGPGPEGEDLYDLLVRETNKYAETLLQDQSLPPKTRLASWEPTNRGEIRAFLGLVLLMGLVKKPTISSYWNEGSGHRLTRTPGFGEVMTRNRFQLLLRVVHASDNTEAPPRDQPVDRVLDKFKPMFELVNSSFGANYNLPRDVCIDERIVGFKGRHRLKQYLANKKKDKWGMKMWVLAGAESGYTHQFHAYVSKKLGGPTPAHGVGYGVVMELMEPHLNKGHHVTVDSFFCSPRLCHDLYDNGTFCTGTVTVRRQGMPKSFQTAKKDLRKGQMRVTVQGPLLAVLWHDRKAVTLLSTLAAPRMMRKDNSRGRSVDAPSVVHEYNRTMGGVDLGDQFATLYDPRTRSFKLWRKVLFQLLLTASVNAYVVYRSSWMALRKMGRLAFQESLVASLVGDYQSTQNRRAPRLSKEPCPFRLTGRHFPGVIPLGRRKQCAVCTTRSRVRTWCPDCGCGLFIGNCFRIYHTVVNYRSHLAEE